MSSALQTPSEIARKKDIRLGIFLIVAPLIGLVVLFSLQMLTVILTETPPQPAGGKILPLLGKFIISILGVICLLGARHGIPAGIGLLCRKKQPDNEEYDTRSGSGKDLPAPTDVARWNWGAFFAPTIWGVAHRTWLGLLSIIPLTRIFIMIYFGLYGNAIAWNRNKWKSVEDFHATQRIWAKVFGIIVLIVCAFTVAIPIQYLYEHRGQLMSQIRNSPEEIISRENGFKVTFPGHPSMTEETNTKTGLVVQTTWYEFPPNYGTHLVSVQRFPAQNDQGELIDYEAKISLRDIYLNVIKNKENAKLISEEEVLFRDKKALRFHYTYKNEDIETIIFYNGNIVYSIAVDLLPSEKANPTFDEFIKSFELL